MQTVVDGLGQVDIIATRYGKTPSDVLGVQDPYNAYGLNLICAVVGVKRESDNSPQAAQTDEEELLAAVGRKKGEVRVHRYRPE